MKFFVILSLYFASFTAFADVQDTQERRFLEEANAHFTHRNRQYDLFKAKKLYEEILTGGFGAQAKLEAFERYGRLIIFQTEFGKEIFGEEKHAVRNYNRCVDLSAFVNEKALGYVAESYVYWKGLCLGLWGAYAPFLEFKRKQHRVRELNALVAHGKAHIPMFPVRLFTLMVKGISPDLYILRPSKRYVSHVAMALVESGSKDRPYLRSMASLISGRLAKRFENFGEARTIFGSAIEAIEQQIKKGPASSLFDLERGLILESLKQELSEIN